MARSTISATSKLPSRNGLAMSKMPGSVVPGPFGSFVLTGAVVGVGFGEVVGDGEAEGVRTVGVEAVAKAYCLPLRGLIAEAPRPGKR